MKPSSQKAHQKRDEDGDPMVDLLGEPLGKFDFYVIYKDNLPSRFKTPSPYMPNKPPSVPPCYEKALKYLAKKKPYHKPVDKPPVVPVTFPPIPCYMLNPSFSNYNEDFPPLEDFKNPNNKPSTCGKSRIQFMLILLAKQERLQ